MFTDYSPPLPLTHRQPHCSRKRWSEIAGVLSEGNCRYKKSLSESEAIQDELAARPISTEFPGYCSTRWWQVSYPMEQRWYQEKDLGFDAEIPQPAQRGRYNTSPVPQPHPEQCEETSPAMSLRAAPWHWCSSDLPNLLLVVRNCHRYCQCREESEAYSQFAGRRQSDIGTTGLSSIQMKASSNHSFLIPGIPGNSPSRWPRDHLFCIALLLSISALIKLIHSLLSVLFLHYPSWWWQMG